MVASLRTIKNSLIKSLTAVVTASSELTPASVVALGMISLSAAITAGSVITLALVVALGVIKPKNESVYKVARGASLVGTGGGALLGLVYAGKGSGQSKQSGDRQSSQQTDGSTGQDWRNFVVVRKVKESEEITSFYLQPEDKGEILSFQPGQFLTIKLDIPGQEKPVIRTYSLSDYNEPREYYRLSIKREPMPEGLDVPPGLASNFMHDQVQEGSVIPAKPPSGKFVLDVTKSLPAVLASNGVGITPLISMAKAAGLKGDRPIWFLHGAKNGRFHAFRDEMLALDEQNPNLHIHFTYSRPQAEDAGHYHSTGHVDTELIHSLVTQKAEYFLCGSPPFLEFLREGLKDAGVPESRVFFESFIKASKTSSERPLTGNSNAGEGAEIVFNQSEKTIIWESDADSILDLAEANGLNPPYSCRQGICGTCECRILEGEVEYSETPTAEVDEGSVLICISKPKTSKVVFDL